MIEEGSQEVSKELVGYSAKGNLAQGCVII